MGVEETHKMCVGCNNSSNIAGLQDITYLQSTHLQTNDQINVVYLNKSEYILVLIL